MNYGKPKKGWRFSQTTIKYCIVLQARSPGTYDIIREETILILPSPKTLKGYTGSSYGEEGFTDLMKRRLEMEAKNLDPLELIGSLQIDEMQLKAGLVYQRNTQKYVGKANTLSGVEGVTQEVSEEDPLANSMLNFLFTGLSTSYSIPVGSWLVKRLTGEILLAVTKHVISELEKCCGFQVGRIVTDNAKANVKLFKLLHKDGDKDPEKITHPFNPTRVIFLSSDYTHAFKNARNLMVDRTLKINGKIVSFAPIVLLYEKQKHHNLRLVRFLTRKHVAPTNMERMRVRWAYDVFRPEVVAALKLLNHYKIPGFENVHPLIEFLTMFYRWWQIHDVCNTSQYIRFRMADKMPFYGPNDERLIWLETTFLPWLLRWKNGANSNQFLTQETYEAIVLTTKSTIACVRYLLSQGFNFVLTRKFSTDKLEGLHGAVRHFCGSNDHPDGAAALSAMEKIIRTGLARASIHTNVPLYSQKKMMATKSTLITTVAKKTNSIPRAKEFLQKLSVEELKILSELDREPSELNNVTFL